MASQHITTSPSPIPLFDTERALDQRRERRRVYNRAIELIDWPEDYTPEDYLLLWKGITHKSNHAAIADAIEQYTPDEIATFVIALVQKAVRRE